MTRPKADRQRILQAPLEIAGQAALTAAALRAIGHDAKAFLAPHPFVYAVGGDYRVSANPTIQKLQRIAIAPWMIARFDVFHFHNGTSLVPTFRYADARVARRLGRKVVVEFWGTDIRVPEVESRRNPYYVPGDRERGDLAIERMRTWAEVTGGHVVVADHFADEYLTPHFPYIHVVGQRVDVSRFTPTPPDPSNPLPVVLHAPSNAAIKGTDVVRAAVSELETRGRRFRYVELTGVPADQVATAIASADIVVDQLRLGSHGIFAVEAMAAAKPVMCHIAPYMASAYPRDLPIIDAHPDNFVDVLDDWLHRSEDRHSVGLEGRRYVEVQHDHLAVARRLESVYASLPA